MRLCRAAAANTASGTGVGNGERTRVIATPVRKLTLMAVSPGPLMVTWPRSSTCATVSSADANRDHTVTSSVAPLEKVARTAIGVTLPGESVASPGVTSSETKRASASDGAGIPDATQRASTS